MAVALNLFKTITANVTTTGESVYTAPTGYTTVVLMAQVSNTGNAMVTVTADHVRSSNHTNIITDGELPPNDALNLLSGKMILQTSDSFYVRGSANDTAQLILSILETANP